MVCLGNICRSPLAEGILQSKLNSKDFFVDSAGTAAYHIGNSPDTRSIQVAKKYGIDIKNQRARQFTTEDFIKFDCIYAMDAQNYRHICSLAKDVSDVNKVKMILEESNFSKSRSVPDPYYGDDDGFETVYQLLNHVCGIIANKLLKSKSI